jgi:hypothetical protein
MPNSWVTTIDNPFDPFTQFDDWHRFDSDKHYYTCEYIARIAKTSNDLDEEAYSNAIDEAVDSIVRLNVNGLYKKVYEKQK